MSIVISDANSAELDVIANRRVYRNKWQTEDDHYWLERLMQEVGEAAGVLAKDHDDSLEHELIQIASICINWISLRRGLQ